MINLGMVIDQVFRQSDDRIGIGYTWSDPADSSLDIQHEIDSYYRVQLTPEIEIGPTFRIIFDPVHNPNEDTIFVGRIFIN